MRVLLSIAAAGVVVTAFSVRYVSGALYVPPPPPAAPPTIEDATPKLITVHLPIGNGDTLDQILARADVDPNTRFEMLNAFNQAYSVRRVRPGRDLLVTLRADTREVNSLEYVADADSEVVLHRYGGISEAKLVEVPGTIKTVPVCATLEGSLFETVDRAGEDPQLALLVADIFSFDIDFYRDAQAGDEFCILVEKKFYDNGQPPTYKRVLAAQYNNAGTMYDAYRFASDGGSGQFFTGDGRSLRSAFLRSPLAFDARVSSHFSYSRLHPVLHTRRAHLGTDYAAPTGTPVRAVASGRVAVSSYTSGNGNYVSVNHADGYRTMYLHFSRRLVKAGQHVEQGQTIGLVGSTGLASGPHVDIRISKNGKFMDWERLRAPRTVTLSSQQKESFGLERDRLKALMEAALKSPQVASNRTASSGF